jgi:hypothetical protein
MRRLGTGGMLATLFVAIASWQLRRPWIFRFGNQLRSALSATTIISVVACSFVLSTGDFAATRSRLSAAFRKNVHYAVELNLAEELKSSLERNPQQHTVIPDYISSFAKIKMDPVALGLTNSDLRTFGTPNALMIAS